MDFGALFEPWRTQNGYYFVGYFHSIYEGHRILIFQSILLELEVHFWRIDPNSSLILNKQGSVREIFYFESCI